MTAKTYIAHTKLFVVSINLTMFFHFKIILWVKKDDVLFNLIVYRFKRTINVKSYKLEGELYFKKTGKPFATNLK